MIWMMALAALGSEREEKLMIEFSAPRFSVTAGGAQDVRYFRDRVADGGIPLPEVFTPEGLLSEHDLPIPSAPCDRLLCVDTAAADARLLAQDEVRWLGQIGFGTHLTPATFQRPPLNLVAVVDQSCSMTGPIELVRSGLTAMVNELHDGDQLSIVLYGSGVTTHLAPTQDRRAMQQAIASIAIDGSTNMEAGMLRGFELARETRRSFDGTTRLMLFTDERPNVGNTDAGGFMALARAGSHAGIGMTTVGVGVQFGAELASAVSSVRGGNLYFFGDEPTLLKEINEGFDTWVTELAYDLELVVTPAPGTRVAGIYGVPGDAVEFRGTDLVVHVETLFLSRDAGAIYVGFAPTGNLPLTSDRLGSVRLSYTARDGEVTPRSTDFVRSSEVPLGLARGRLLVDEATALKQATLLHHRQNDQAGAYQLVHALADRLRADRDPTLDPERTLVERLEQTLAAASGRGEPTQTASGRSEVSGLPMLVTGG